MKSVIRKHGWRKMQQKTPHAVTAAATSVRHLQWGSEQQMPVNDEQLLPQLLLLHFVS